MMTTQAHPPAATTKATCNKQKENFTVNEKMKSNEKKLITGVSPGQYFSNSSSIGNTNGYYIKNSVRE
jgi:hypothetical protein